MNEPVLERALAALHPIRDRLVVVGGTAHRLFHLHELAESLPHDLLTTEDIDFAAPLDLAFSGDGDLIARLEEAGFSHEVAGVDEPSHRYRFGGGLITLQFIAPLIGSGTTRKGTRDRTLQFSGVVAEKLRSVEILLHAPWPLELGGRPSESVLVVNPLAFLAQKLLILPTRRFDKLGKDVLYVHDTLSMFANRLEDLRARYATLLPRLTRKQEQAILAAIERFFRAPGDAAREAARIALSQRPDPPSADSLARACREGLKHLFEN